MRYNVESLKDKILNTVNKVSFPFYLDSCFNFSEKVNKYVVLPGLVDVHVHLREPGFSYKETIKSGSKASAHGGFTAVCSMPNLNPAPHNLENLKIQTDIIKNDSVINVYPYGTITKDEMGNELSAMDELAPNVIGFSDDGHGVQSIEIMKSAMKKAHELNKIIVAHCEENSLLNGGYIHDGEYAKKHSHKGISSASEYVPVKRDIELSKETNCKYHVCHISAKETVEIIRNAKADGVDITCETAPHYLILTDEDLQENGRFKMNPPLRSREDRAELINGIKDGTIDMIITDHAPHSLEEKSKGLEKSAMGVVGIETSFPLMYTNFVKTNVISIEKLIELMHDNPCKRFNINTKNDFTIFDTETEYEINPDNFLSMGKSTPFEGVKVFGKCVLTVSNEKVAYYNKEYLE